MDQYDPSFNPEEMFNTDSASNQQENPNDQPPHQHLQDQREIYLPLANVIRIMRRILPPHAKITDDAKETIQLCVSEFIKHITGEANRKRYGEVRQTIISEDIISSMAQLCFSEYVEPLTMMLNRVRSQVLARASSRHTPVARTRARNQVNPRVMARGTRGLNVNPPPEPAVDNPSPAPPPRPRAQSPQPGVDNPSPPPPQAHQSDGAEWSAENVDYSAWFFGDEDEGGSSSGNVL